ncbi:hypothetical protein DESME_08105 [Desulfitobacterium metallireducens DSM 15288]|uniref:Uncharacterized protein n=1 Tax=Desulfitobacterium metallireducens DSM 15288 TaxID=871968 RepID=W0EBW5_9FIRM|nr:hypothetical protein DESME_08105 [Desulfitobacterium metallireducens DSM 15288]
MITRPKEVEYAIKLLLTSLVFGVVAGFTNISASTDNDYLIIYSYIILLGLLFNGYFVYKISQNRNWARKFYIVFTLLSLIYYVPQWVTLFTSVPFNGLLQMVNILIQLSAVYFLLHKGAKEWFQLVNNKG